MRTQLQDQRPGKSQRDKHVPWLRLILAIIISLLLSVGALLLVLSTGHILPSYWYYILPAIFTIIGIIIPLLQWLFPLPPTAQEPAAPAQPPLRQPHHSSSAERERPTPTTKRYSHDVVLSYAEEDGEYAEALARALRDRGVSVFYDKFEVPELWGKNLYDHLSDLYLNNSHFCVMLLSQHYATRLWANLERRTAQARAFEEREEYILPIRLDDTKIQGILPTVSYLRWPPETAETISDIIGAKLNNSAGAKGRREVGE